MSYIYDFKSFIDSPDIREYVSEEMFSPGEQAVLISRSSKPLSEKIRALEYLAETYFEDFYCSDTKCTAKNCDKKKIMLKDLIARTVADWKEILKKCFDDKDVFFAALLMEKGYERNGIDNYKYFKNYEAAYQYLKEEKKRYLEDDDLKDLITYGEIRRIPLNDLAEDKHGLEIYDFDTDMNLYRVYQSSHRDWADMTQRLLTEYYVHVPVPFKDGDLVESDIGCAGSFIARYSKNADLKEEVRYRYCEMGDDSDLTVLVHVYDEEEEQWYWDHADILSLRYAKECAYNKESVEEN